MWHRCHHLLLLLLHLLLLAVHLLPAVESTGVQHVQVMQWASNNTAPAHPHQPLPRPYHSPQQLLLQQQQKLQQMPVLRLAVCGVSWPASPAAPAHHQVHHHLPACLHCELQVGLLLVHYELAERLQLLRLVGHHWLQLLLLLQQLALPLLAP
jgi:hypothetical protein